MGRTNLIDLPAPLDCMIVALEFISKCHRQCIVGPTYMHNLEKCYEALLVLVRI